MSETVNNDLNSNDSKTLVIGSGIRMEGKIDGALNSDISGSYNGKIKSESINISETGVFVGDITGGDINISGKVEGTIISDDLLNIHQSAVINGTIEYTSLKVSYGARVQGKIQHKGVVQSFNKLEENSTNEKDQENI
ncbi:MAG: bactofilin family protein [Alphaproteobacteria bacterium]